MGCRPNPRSQGLHRISESLNHVFGVRTLKRKGGSGFEKVDEGLQGHGAHPDSPARTVLLVGGGGVAAGDGEGPGSRNQLKWVDVSREMLTRLQRELANMTLVLLSVKELGNEDMIVGVDKSPHFQIKRKGRF